MEGKLLLDTLGAITIGISGLCIIAGLVFIKKNLREYHKRSMITASFFALIFVALYLIKNALYPPEKYMGPYRGLFLTILWSHTILALVNFPLAVVTLFYGLKGLHHKHRKVAPITAFVWIYVAFTGWLIYVFMRWLNP
ncbi:DUF420 domain-containing protein [Thermocrinis minervae]|uniref:Putative membrane protein n=1 Tax=Thermocrinis minervae TaxID=381751 RepID=A0A1M6S2H0_9AQUI|nr:DUF420 domain-containing protein [Thermocrinis minervae]SHK38876.1 putative membrane protein [Thermocrinis minervae]